jgi:hypothetical protein
MDGLQPDDKTICNFRTDNTQALKKTFGEFSLMCRELGLYGGEVEAAAGTKVRANNSRKNNHNKTTVEKELTRIDKRSNVLVLRGRTDMRLKISNMMKPGTGTNAHRENALNIKGLRNRREFRAKCTRRA